VLCAAFMEAYLTHYGAYIKGGKYTKVSIFTPLAYMVHQYPYPVHTGSERGSACLP
jgi:hypothetical protein